MSDPTPSPPERPRDGGRPGRWIRVALAISLGLNLAIAGLVVGAALKARHDDTRGAPTLLTRVTGLGPYLQALPPEQQRALGRTARSAERRSESGGRTLIFDMRRSLREVLRTLRTEPFDADRFASLLAEQSARLETRRGYGQRALAEMLARMPPEERAAYADRLERSVRRRRHPD